VDVHAYLLFLNGNKKRNIIGTNTDKPYPGSQILDSTVALDYYLRYSVFKVKNYLGHFVNVHEIMNRLV